MKRFAGSVASNGFPVGSLRGPSPDRESRRATIGASSLTWAGRAAASGTSNGRQVARDETGTSSTSKKRQPEGNIIYADTYQIGDDAGSDGDYSIETMPCGPDRW